MILRIPGVAYAEGSRESTEDQTHYNLTPDPYYSDGYRAVFFFSEVPIARQHEVSQAIFADQNNFPREIALEAILRFIEEDLESGAADTVNP